MTIEQLVPIIVKSLREISEWPWNSPNNGAVNDARGELTSLIYAKDAREKRWYWECDPSNAIFVASSPLWLAQMVIGVVKAKAEGHCNWQDHTHAWCDWSIELALHDFGLTPEDWMWLKGKMGG